MLLSGNLISVPPIFIELKRNCSQELIIFIVGSKADLHRHRQVTSDRVRLSIHKWFPPPRPPSPPPPPTPQPSTLSYIRPRFTSFTSTRTAPVNALSPKALDDNTLSRPSEIRRANTTSPHPRIDASANALRRANSTNAALSPQRGRPHDRLIQASRFGSHFGLQTGGYVDTLDGSSNSLPEEDEEDDDSDDTEWGLERGMSLFEVSSKDDQGLSFSFGFSFGSAHISFFCQALGSCLIHSSRPSSRGRTTLSGRMSRSDATASSLRQSPNQPGALRRKKRKKFKRLQPRVAGAVARYDGASTLFFCGGLISFNYSFYNATTSACSSFRSTLFTCSLLTSILLPPSRSAVTTPSPLSLLALRLYLVPKCCQRHLRYVHPMTQFPFPHPQTPHTHAHAI